MPIYEYQCEKCGEITEVMQRITEDPLTDCACGGKGTLHRLISLTSFRLKGTGWYETDFKGKGNGKSESHAPKAATAPVEHNASGESSPSTSESSTNESGTGSEKATPTETKSSDSTKDSASGKAKAASPNI